MKALVPERNLLEKWGPIEDQQAAISERLLAGFPGANIKGFWQTILSEAERSQIHLFEPKGRVLDLQ